MNDEKLSREDAAAQADGRADWYVLARVGDGPSRLERLSGVLSEEGARMLIGSLPAGAGAKLLRVVEDYDTEDRG